MAKRTYGNGRVFKRGVRWWVAYYVDGAEQRDSCGPNITTKADAQKVLRQRLQAVDMALAGPTVTVGALLDLFVADQRNQARKARKDAEARAEKIRESLGGMRVADVTPRHVERFVAKLRAAKRSGPTINRYRAVWQRAFRLGSDAGLRVSPPYWPRHAESAPKRDHMSPETYQSLLGQLAGAYRAILVAAYWTGCRQGELRAWRWEHVDLDRRVVLIPDSKNGHPRVVPMAEAVWRELLMLQMRRDRDWPASPWVFTLDGAKALAKDALRAAWERACKNAGLPRLRFHGLRHTAISEMRAAGVEEGAAMAITGHRTRAVFDRYGIQPEAKLREAIGKREASIRTKHGQSDESEGPTPAPQ